ncbi:MAG: hypothetical protein EHM23_33480 [Acidobacteria bacterium]|nr:MAG: hypothetical protein EHM23_33480 [Acidobacteriota bacterium]
MLAIIAGMRPGEIFALKWADIHDDYLDVKQRLYRGLIDSPKTNQSVRRVALSDGLQLQLSLWRASSPIRQRTPGSFPLKPGRRLWQRTIAGAGSSSRSYRRQASSGPTSR